VLVADDLGERIAPTTARNSRAARGTARLEGSPFQAFELDADRPVVAVVAASPGDTPACQARWSQDTNCSTWPSAPDEEVRRHLQAAQAAK
jgi:hypothetical protein